jgi:hypothetical protein
MVAIALMATAPIVTEHLAMQMDTITTITTIIKVDKIRMM